MSEGPRGGKSAAKCAVSVRGNIADLDYGGDHAGHNERRFYVGTMRLIFSDSSRKTVSDVQWRDHDGAEFEECDVECRDLIQSAPPSGPFPDPTSIEDGRKKIERMVTLRQGQPAFRKALMDAYERRCAVTGCTIDDVLEAAHISPYLGEHTNHVTNGLLLRADIHTLFDRGLIKVGSDYRITARHDIKAAYDLPEFITVPEAISSRPDKRRLKSRAILP
ncbi:HNH endonuclease signature motif containing protein [Sphingomonas aerolata]|uniref:HNH endonuclease n=1 Tax=Sphingomonas aerolata TaxID=185951 RepID=UPI002FE05DAC